MPSGAFGSRGRGLCAAVAQAQARAGDPDFYDFSFSGLKTALRERIRAIEAERPLEAAIPDLAAGFQAAVTEAGYEVRT